MTVWSNPVYRLIILGTADPQSELSRFKGNRDCLGLIFEELENQWRDHIEESTGYVIVSSRLRFPKPIRSFLGKRVELNVNMMPIIMGDIDSMPKNCQRYFWLVDRCIEACPDEYGKVGYLTVHESFVKKGSSQRRPGLHTESPGTVSVEDGEVFHWGDGKYRENFLNGCVEGGIFMASNIDDSCAVWDVVIDRHEELVGNLGDIEFLRDILEDEDFLPLQKMVRANELIWMTDRTPHESLPLDQDSFRQYFRLVTSNVTGWYEQHSTKNPLGIQPATSLIISENKFLQQCSLNDS